MFVLALVEAVLRTSCVYFNLRHQIKQMAAAETLPSVYLQRWGNQSPISYSTAELDRILAHLTAASTQSTLGYDDVWFAAASPFLLIVDVRWSVNRRLSELFEIAIDRTKPFNLRFVSDEAVLDLTDAMYACGYTGSALLNLPQLAGVYMAIYRSQSGAGDYATNVGRGIQLVAEGGGDNQAARIRSLRGSGALQVSLSPEGDSVDFSINTAGSGSLLDLETVQAWRYVADPLDANQGTSLIVQSGGGAQSQVGCCVSAQLVASRWQQDRSTSPLARRCRHRPTRCPASRRTSLCFPQALRSTRATFEASSPRQISSST